MYGLSVTINAPLKPSKAMNKPIPAGIAFFKQSGRDLAMYDLKPVTERIKKIKPERSIITKPAP